jgi:hypothetical protein
MQCPQLRLGAGRIDMTTPIEITLYNKDSEPAGTYSQSVITFDMLMRASKLEEMLEDQPEGKKKMWWWLPWVKEKNEYEKQINLLMTFVADFFANQFTPKQLRKGADVAEVMSVVRAIMARANQIVETNPTKPPRPHR